MKGGPVGEIIGGVIGFAGGALGTYTSIKNTRGARERQFMVRVAVAAWLGITLFVVRKRRTHIRRPPTRARLILR